MYRKKKNKIDGFSSWKSANKQKNIEDEEEIEEEEEEKDGGGAVL